MKRDIKQLKAINTRVAEIIGEPETITAAAVGRLSDKDLERVAAGDYEPLFQDFPNLKKITSGNGAKGTPAKKNKTENIKPIKERKHKENTVKKELERVRAEIVPRQVGNIETCGEWETVPEIITENINALLDNYCERFKIDDMTKARQTQWKAACMYIGESLFKRTDILKRRTETGTKVYDINKLEYMRALWAGLCLSFGKAPFVDDFCYFCGLSDTWVYGAASRDELTPERAVLLKKLQMLQEQGLAGLIADGRQNPTGALAILNHWHGWTQSREIIHTTAQETRTAASYPQLEISTDANNDI